MKGFRKVVDERQELEMFRVERSTFWVLLFALMVSILVQLFALDFDFAHVAGEFVVLIIGSLWSCVGYIRHGLWDYFSKPGIKSYLLYSLVSGFIFGLLAPLVRYFRYGASWLDCLRVFATNFAICFALAFVTCFILGTIVKHRQKKLQQEYKNDL